MRKVFRSLLLFSAMLVAGVFLTTTTGHADQILVSANHHTYHATLANNSSAKKFQQRLKSGPVVVKAHDYNNMEKVGNLPWSLPRNDRQLHVKAGSIILYQGKQLSLYYNKNSWKLTPIANISNVTSHQLKHDLGNGKVNIKYSLPN